MKSQKKKLFRTILSMGVLVALAVAFLTFKAKPTVPSDSLQPSHARLQIQTASRSGASHLADRSVFRKNIKRSLQAATTADESAVSGIDQDLVFDHAVGALRMKAIARHFSSQGPTVMEEMIQEQDKNEAWTSEITDALRARFKSMNDDGGKIREVDCRQTVCKIVTEHSNLEHSNAFFDTEDDQDILNGSSNRFTRELADGSTQSLLYLGSVNAPAKFHDTVYNRLYERVTGKSVDDIDPSQEQLDASMAYFEKERAYVKR